MAFKPLEHKIPNLSFVYIFRRVHPFTQTTERTLTSRNVASAVISLCGTTEKEKEAYTASRIYGNMPKAKMTVSVDRTVLESAKLALLRKHRTLSDYVDKSLRSLSASELLEGLCRDLGLHCHYISGEEVERNRPDLTGKIDSASEVRRLRDERSSRLS